MTPKLLASSSLIALACMMASLAQAAPSTSSTYSTSSTPASAAADVPASAPPTSAASTPSGQDAQPGGSYIDRAGDAVIAPLGDLNLVRAKIPDALKEALAAPYAEPPVRECPAIAKRIHALDAALGADLDAPRSANDPSLLERGVDQVGKASINMISDTTTGIVPFRGWVRRLTGAERHSKRVAAAITAGSLRRAYLKGYSRALACPATVASTAQAAASAPASAASAP